jgi:flavin-dependent dehydrogenase
MSIVLSITAPFAEGAWRGAMTFKSYDYDLVVIGSGPAGQKGALCAAELGKKVAIVDRKWPSGKAGVHSGTIVSKTLREAVLNVLRQRTFYGSSEAVRYHVEMFDLTFRVQTPPSRPKPRRFNQTSIAIVSIRSRARPPSLTPIPF